MNISLLLVKYTQLVTAPGWDELVEEYVREASDPAMGAPRVNDEAYIEASERGEVECIGVFAGERIVGVAIVRFADHPHYEHPIAAADALYLMKAYRRGAVGLNLLGAMRALAARRGATGLVFTAPPDTAFDRLCGRLGMKHTHNAYWFAVNE